MIRVQPAAEPPDFDAKVRQRGKAALQELIGSAEAPRRRGRPRAKLAEKVEDIPSEALPPLWTEALPALRAAYRDICAYLGMYIDPATGLATVDHFKPKSKPSHRALAYEWSNFRLASHQINTNKGDHEDVLDPFEIQDGWFVIDLGTFKVEPGEGLDDDLRAAVIATRDRLGLNSPTFCASRERYHDLYLGLQTAPDDPDEPLPLAWIRRHCPFMAHELERQGRLRPSDRESTR
ncbi:hypothetical protein [Sorangium sp. So ce385]|uniref:hypothetical protein n=1 Tax=Sorangium sp. So ce385 TaxID=3133308 RepID=UPI003F5BBE43